MRIIELEPRPPASILLLGRSGTGKTTVLVFRLFAAWLSAYQHTHRHQHCVFVTASATLKEQVRESLAWAHAGVMLPCGSVLHSCWDGCTHQQFASPRQIQMCSVCDAERENRNFH
jgi:hypothetical protein